MKQVIQDLKTGVLRLDDVPPPVLQPGGILVRTTASLISAGTERATVLTARQGLIGKAISRPDLVGQVVEHLKRQGLRATIQKVRTRLNTPKPMGYSSTGVVVGVGEGVKEFQPGDRIACGGTGYANHAEVIIVPKNLAACVPAGVSDEAAAFTTVGAIALHGCRQAGLAIGESVAVIGLGLVGQLTVQLLKAMGCRVVGLDLDHAMVNLAVESGADLGLVVPDPGRGLEAKVGRFTAGRGVDAVIITASSSSNDPIETATAIVRDRGRLVIVGAVRMDLPRTPCYEKELEIRFARSYGPGRYDPAYEERGEDYPYGYVRWTEQRNMEEFLRLVADGKVHPERLITDRFSLTEAARAYDRLVEPAAPRPVGILLTYASPPVATTARDSRQGSVVRLAAPAPASRAADEVGLGVIGAGHFAQDVLLPIITRQPHVRLVGVCTRTGLMATQVAQQFRFEYATADSDEIFRDDRVHAVCIATRHDQHASLVIKGLRAGKAVFVEKPLALTPDELRDVMRVLEETSGRLTVGFNRRFSSHTDRVKTFFGPSHGPMAMTYRVNAGPLPPGHWLLDAREGGGRVIGEVCHFVDFLQYVAAAAPTEVYATAAGRPGPMDETVQITIRFADGSVGTVAYVASGDAAFPKERVELFADGGVAVIDDFKACTLSRGGRTRRFSALAQDKGHRRELEAFLGAVRRGDPMPIPSRELAVTTDCTFKAVESLRTGVPIALTYG